MVKISVIMPVYNDADNLDNSIGSFLNQTLNDIELVCVNDGSIDDSLDILNKYSQEYENIKVLCQENQGSGKARNYGIDKSNGEYIGFLDADDFFIDNDALERIYEVAIKNDALMVSGNIKLVDDEGEFHPFSFLKYYDDYETILPEEYGIPWAFYKNIFKKEFLIENNIIFPDLLRGQDPVFLAEILSKIDKIYMVPTDFYAYYFIGGSKHCNTRQKRFDHIMQYKMVFDYLKDSKFDDIRCKFKIEMFGFIDMMGIDGGKDILDAVHEVFKDETKILKDFEAIFYIKHKNHKELAELIEFNPEKPCISVIIPICNNSKYIHSSLGTVLNQTFYDFEVICVDYGSSDDSVEIIKDIVTKDSRIRLITLENKNIENARNIGLNNSKGNYVLFMDPFDELSLDLFEESYKNAIYNDSDLVIFKANNLTNNGIDNEIMYFNFPLDFRINNDSSHIFNFKEVEDNVVNWEYHPWCKLYKKEFLDKHDDLRFDEDISFAEIPFHVKCMLRSKMTYLNVFFYHHRNINNNSLNHLDLFKVIDTIEKLLKEENCFNQLKKSFYKFELSHIFKYINQANTDNYFNLAKEKLSEIDSEYITINQDKYEWIMESETYSEYKYRCDYSLFLKKKSKLDKKLEYTLDTNKKLKKENKKLKKENKNYKKLNKEILNSNCWKIRKHLRKLKNLE